MMKTLILSLTILLLINSNNYCNADEGDETVEVEETFSVPESTGHAFLETFQDDPFSRWVESSDSTYDGQKWVHEARQDSSEFYASDKVSCYLYLYIYIIYFFTYLSFKICDVDTHIQGGGHFVFVIKSNGGLVNCIQVKYKGRYSFVMFISLLEVPLEQNKKIYLIYAP